jgi:hypothetical protein
MVMFCAKRQFRLLAPLHRLAVTVSIAAETIGTFSVFEILDCIETLVVKLQNNLN